MRLRVSRIAVLLLTPLLTVFLPQRANADVDQVCLNQVCFDKQAKVGDVTIPLIGLTRFEYLFFDVYTIALYGPKEARSSEEILKDVPKRLVFHYHRDISREDMIEGADKNLEQNPTVNRSSFGTQLATINQWYVDVAEGDRYALTFVPNQGLTLSFNGKPLGTVRGDAFSNVYFGIWLSRYPLSESLRDGLFTRP